MKHILLNYENRAHRKLQMNKAKLTLELQRKVLSWEAYFYMLSERYAENGREKR